MIVAVVLAGGGGTRLGGVDKAFLDLGGKPLLARVLARLAPQVGRIVISANGDPGRFAPFGLQVISDGGFDITGPLAGVAAGLAWAAGCGAEALLTVPVDTPFIPLDLARRLSPAAAVATWQGRQHHLVALWPASLLPRLLALPTAPRGPRVREALALCEARTVAFGEAEDPFLNINTPADLAAAEARRQRNHVP